jgi:glutathione synthase/RimK-type ligase-like ATP-grasp enzyme
MKEFIKNIILKSPNLKKFYTNFRIKKGIIIHIKNLNLDEANKVFLDKPLKKSILVGLVKDGLTHDESYITLRAYYPKYERFLINNNIPYAYFDIYSDNWQKEAQKFDVVVWHSQSDPASQYIAKNKIYILEKYMGKVCLPGYDEIWSYEDKINAEYIYRHFKLQAVPNFVSGSKKEALEYVQKANYPLISKITTGSSSLGVEIIKTKKQATKTVNVVFSNKGKKTVWPFQRQKDYVYFQTFIDTASYDLRVIVVDNKLFGYYRFAKKGDFRASGSGITKKMDIPAEALEIAYQVKKVLGSTFLATDMLFDENEKKFLIIETSIFIGIDTCKQLAIDGIHGYYVRMAENEYAFKEGKFWMQELALKELLENRLT